MKRLLGGLFAVACFTSLAAPVSADTYSIEGASAASLTGIVPQTLAQYTAKEGVDLQVVLGQTLTKSALKVAAKKLDLAVVPPPAFAAMKRGAGPYAGQAEQAKKLSQNVRTLFGFPGGTFQAIAWADGDVQTWEDIKGKRIYIGPPAGAAGPQIVNLIKVASGYEEGKDYEGIKAPWGAAQQSFQDGQFDVYVAAAAIGQQTLTELSLQREIVILGVPEEIVESPAWQTYLEDYAVDTATIPAGTYSGQANGDQALKTAVTTMMVATNTDLPDEAAYEITKAYWQNIDEMKAGNALLRQIDPNRPFAGVNAPLHPGALRYYREAGIEVPERLIAN
ncbi:TAXI family TRAP transporter solute-binding subunit [Amorphus sp. 3PC139-8]|uniref:TAXI family TRAP transporter solute-binding subunit n=1 Tax=Amorphus sp. 3PC139-8 TaxID=2735676 RepID=UPI00345D17B4